MLKCGHCRSTDLVIDFHIDFFIDDQKAKKAKGATLWVDEVRCRNCGSVLIDWSENLGSVGEKVSGEEAFEALESYLKKLKEEEILQEEDIILE